MNMNYIISCQNKRQEIKIVPPLCVAQCTTRFQARMCCMYEGVSKSFRTVHLERELQMVQLSATRCSCMAILWANPVSFVAITLCVASQWACIVVNIYFVIDSVRKLLDTPSYFVYVPVANPRYVGPCHHGMVLPRVTDGRDVLQIQIRKAAAIYILNKQSRTADKRLSSSLGVGRGDNNYSS
jgi:hypothetical protein